MNYIELGEVVLDIIGICTFNSLSWGVVSEIPKSTVAENWRV